MIQSLILFINQRHYMLKLFKKRISPIQKITFPTFNWKKTQNSEDSLQWINPKENIMISLKYIDLPPEIPSLQDIQKTRSYYRTIIASYNAGVIEIENIILDGVRSLKTLFKQPQTPIGMSYVTSLTIPFANCSYELKIQAQESNLSGMRDSFIADILMAENEISIANGNLVGWFKDPYQPNLKEGVLMNRSEEIQYDSQFPEHPLSQCRTLMKEIVANLALHPTLKNLPQFSK